MRPGIFNTSKPDYREKLKAGKNLVGMMHFTASPMLIEVAASAGVDFINVDMEHSPIGLEMAAHLIRTCEAAGITPFIRVPDVDPGLIKKLLNLGYRGILVPHCSYEDCVAAVDAVLFEPEGIRGSCPAVRSSGYTQPDWGAFQAATNADVTVIPLLEDMETVDNVDKFFALKGVDIVFLGPFDFSISLGVPGANFDHPKMAAALDKLVARARAHGKYVMTSVGAKINDDYARMIYSRGVNMISYSADALIFLEACRQIVAARG